jgi:hypothetical protein
MGSMIAVEEYTGSKCEKRGLGRMALMGHKTARVIRRVTKLWH